MYRCFIGGLSWDTTDRGLEDAFLPYGTIVDAKSQKTKVVFDRAANRSRGFGFITFETAEGMDNAIKKMNGTELDGRVITVTKAEDKSNGTGRERDRDRDRRGSGASGAGGECFKCGNKGHWARDCHNRGRDRDRSDRSDRGERGDRDRERDRERSSDKHRSGEDRHRGGDDRYDSRGGGGRSDRGGDRYNSRDNGRRSGPYDRPPAGGRYSNGGSRDDQY